MMSLATRLPTRSPWQRRPSQNDGEINDAEGKNWSDDANVANNFKRRAVAIARSDGANHSSFFSTQRGTGDRAGYGRLVVDYLRAARAASLWCPHRW